MGIFALLPAGEGDARARPAVRVEREIARLLRLDLPVRCGGLRSRWLASLRERGLLTRAAGSDGMSLLQRALDLGDRLPHDPGWRAGVASVGRVKQLGREVRRICSHSPTTRLRP